MLILSKTLASSLLITAISLTTYNQDVNAHPFNLSQTPGDQANVQTVPLLLQPAVEVTRKDGGKTLGTLTSFDPQKELKVTRGGQQQVILITQTVKISFLQAIVNGKPQPLPPIQGERRTWEGIPLDSLKILNLNKGEAKITLPQGVDPRVSNKQEYVYVVEELSFPAANKLNVRVTILK